MFFPELHTTRLFLREHTVNDVNVYYRLLSNLDAVRYYGRKPIRSIAEAENEINMMRQSFLSSKSIKWAIMSQINSQYIGCVGIKDFTNAHKRGTLSCIIHPSCWNSGYAHEALFNVIDYSFTTLALNRVQAFVDPQNIRAVSLFKSLGFTQEAILKEYEFEYNNYIDIAIFGMVKKM